MESNCFVVSQKHHYFFLVGGNIIHMPVSSTDVHCICVEISWPSTCKIISSRCSTYKNVERFCMNWENIHTSGQRLTFYARTRPIS